MVYRCVSAPHADVVDFKLFARRIENHTELRGTFGAVERHHLLSVAPIPGLLFATQIDLTVVVEAMKPATMAIGLRFNGLEGFMNNPLGNRRYANARIPGNERNSLVRWHSQHPLDFEARLNRRA